MRGATHQVTVHVAAAGAPTLNDEGQVTAAAPTDAGPVEALVAQLGNDERTEGQRERGHAEVAVHVDPDLLAGIGVTPALTDELTVAGAGALDGRWLVDELHVPTRRGRTVRYLVHRTT